jgi:hypothetical protein
MVSINSSSYEPLNGSLWSVLVRELFISRRELLSSQELCSGGKYRD